jgi:phage-related protein
MSVFTYVPVTAQLTKKPRVTEATFGDGYKQRTAFGLNTNPQTWALAFVFTGSATAHLGWKSFLDALNGTTAFDWTPPGESSSMRFVCKDYGVTVDPGNVYRCSAVFEQDFGN